jgi:putative salt-induced outer membrane protein YdiY
MLRPLSVAFFLALAPLALAQDKVTLRNGDVITGIIKTMADGKITVTSPMVGDVTVPIANVVDITTGGNVKLVGKNGDIYDRRIAGLDNGQLKLDGEPPLTGLLLSSLGAINPPLKPPDQWTGSVRVNGAWVGGNTDRRAIGAAFEAVRRSDIDRISADAAWDYAEDMKQDDPATVANEHVWSLTQRRAGAGLKYDYFLSKKVYALASTRALSDTLADLKLRYTIGAGLGYQMIENDDTNLLVEGGLSYLNESYRSATPGVDYIAARLAYKVSQKLSEATKLLHGTEAFPSLEHARDVNFTMRTELQTNLTASMIASLGWFWDWDNTPSPGHDRSDHRVLLSIGWTF